MPDFNPPTTTLFSHAHASSGVTDSVTYDSLRGYSHTRTDGGTGSADRYAFRGKAVPSGSSWDAIMRMQTGAAASSDAVRRGLALHESSTGKMMFVGLNNQIGGMTLCVLYMSSDTAGITNSGLSETTIIGKLPEYFKIHWDGTNYTFYVSFDDAITWIQLCSITAASHFTADYIGVVSESGTTLNSVAKPVTNVLYYHDPDF